MKILSIMTMFVLIMTMVCADVAFSGVVYDDHFGGKTIGDVDIRVSCGTSSSIKSYSDGSYAVSFSDSSCTDGSKIVFEFYRDGFKNLRFENFVNYSSMQVFNFGSVILRSDVFNVIMNKEGKSYEIKKCEEWFLDCTLWSSCINGIEMRTCSSNCEINRNEFRDCYGNVLFSASSGNRKVLVLN